MTGALLGVLASIAVSVLVREVLDNSGWIAERLLAMALRRLPWPEGERMEAEWAAELEFMRPRRGKLMIIQWAARIYLHSGQQARALRDMEFSASVHVLRTGERVLEISGHMERNIVFDGTVVVMRGARVSGAVRCKQVEIVGDVVGNVYASRSALVDSAGSLRGDVVSKRIKMIDGARFNGVADVNGALYGEQLDVGQEMEMPYADNQAIQE